MLYILHDSPTVRPETCKTPSQAWAVSVGEVTFSFPTFVLLCVTVTGNGERLEALTVMVAERGAPVVFFVTLTVIVAVLLPDRGVIVTHDAGQAHCCYSILRFY